VIPSLLLIALVLRKKFVFMTLLRVVLLSLAIKNTPVAQLALEHQPLPYLQHLLTTLFAKQTLMATTNCDASLVIHSLSTRPIQ